MDIGAGDRLNPEFLAIVDLDGPGGASSPLIESAAILIHPAEKTGSGLLPSDPATRHRRLQRVMFEMGGVGPMPGRNNHLANHAPEKLPYAVERCTNEVGRPYRALGKRLGESALLAGPDYSIADIRTFPWTRDADRRGIDLGVYPAVKRWHDAIAARRCSPIAGARG